MSLDYRFASAADPPGLFLVALPPLDSGFMSYPILSAPVLMLAYGAARPRSRRSCESRVHPLNQMIRTGLELPRKVNVRHSRRKEALGVMVSEFDQSGPTRHVVGV